MVKVMNSSWKFNIFEASGRAVRPISWALEVEQEYGWDFLHFLSMLTVVPVVFRIRSKENTSVG